MNALILVGAVLVCVLCVLAFTLPTYALPFMVGLAAARLALATGAGGAGAGLVGLMVGVIAFAVLASLFSRLQSPVLRGIVMIVFVGPLRSLDIASSMAWSGGLCRPRFGVRSSASSAAPLSGARPGSGWRHRTTAYDHAGLQVMVASPRRRPARVSTRRCEGTDQSPVRRDQRRAWAGLTSLSLNQTGVDRSLRESHLVGFGGKVTSAPAEGVFR